jgi:preprotein translocase subunit SecE
MDRETPVRELLREADPVLGVTVVFAVLYYIADWVRTDLGETGGIFELVGSFLTTVIGVTGIALVLIYVVARGVALGMEEVE